MDKFKYAGRFDLKAPVETWLFAGLPWRCEFRQKGQVVASLVRVGNLYVLVQGSAPGGKSPVTWARTNGVWSCDHAVVDRDPCLAAERAFGQMEVMGWVEVDDATD